MVCPNASQKAKKRITQTFNTMLEETGFKTDEREDRMRTQPSCVYELK